MEETEIAVITADETTQEFDLGVAPQGVQHRMKLHWLERLERCSDNRIVTLFEQMMTRMTPWKTTTTTTAKSLPTMQMCVMMLTW